MTLPLADYTANGREQYSSGYRYIIYDSRKGKKHRREHDIYQENME